MKQKGGNSNFGGGKKTLSKTASFSPKRNDVVLARAAGKQMIWTHIFNSKVLVFQTSVIKKAQASPVQQSKTKLKGLQKISDQIKIIKYIWVKIAKKKKK